MGWILVLSTTAGGGRGVGKNEGAPWLKFDIPSLYDASCILGFVFTSLYMRRGLGFMLHWGGFMTEYISFFKNSR